MATIDKNVKIIGPIHIDGDITITGKTTITTPTIQLANTQLQNPEHLTPIITGTGTIK